MMSAIDIISKSGDPFNCVTIHLLYDGNFVIKVNTYEKSTEVIIEKSKAVTLMKWLMDNVS